MSRIEIDREKDILNDERIVSRTVSMHCDQCGKDEGRTITLADADGVYPWKQFPSPKLGHHDPLADPRVLLCSERCARRWFRDFLSEQYPEPELTALAGAAVSMTPHQTP